jgi:hypothetical protein
MKDEVRTLLVTNVHGTSELHTDERRLYADVHAVDEARHAQSLAQDVLTPHDAHPLGDAPLVGSE